MGGQGGRIHLLWVPVPLFIFARRFVEMIDLALEAYPSTPMQPIMPTSKMRMPRLGGMKPPAQGHALCRHG